jgi:hypothetical protein
MLVELGDLILHGQPGPSFNGFAVEKGGLDGWYDLPDAKNDKNERPQAHGSCRRGEIFRESKVISISGFVTSSDQRQAFARRQQLIGMAAAADELTMRVTDDFSSTWRTVVVENVDVPDRSGKVFKYAIDVSAADPRRYDDPVPGLETGLPVAAGGMTWPTVWPVSWGAVGSLGRVSMTNIGYVDSVPVFEISGGLPNGFGLAEVGTDNEIRFEGAVPLGSTLYINPRTGRASLDGQADRSGQVTRSDWWSVKPGATSSVQFTTLGAVLGTPLLTVRFASANW